MRHDRVKKRIAGEILALLAVAVLLGTVFYRVAGREGKVPAQTDRKKETIHFWYTDDILTDYLTRKALEFYNDTDIRVEINLVSGLEFLEAVNEASVSDSADAPDLYLLTNDMLEKAYLAGLAAQLPDSAPVYDESFFSQAARNAVSYGGKYIGCPLYYETSVLLYNKTYLQQIADEANSTREEGDGSQESESLSAEQLIPSSIADILAFADLYSTPENVEYFFRWDVSDIFYNYFFIGNYISVGGAAGDDKSHIDIYNTESVSSLKVYQELNQFFSIDTKETNYDTIMQEFQDGKTIYTIATSDCIKRLDEAAQNGLFPYEYGVAKLPDINQELATRGMSVTNALVLNGYSKHKDAAERFIGYLVRNASADLFDMTGKLSAVTAQDTIDVHRASFMENYTASVPIPKMLETSNFWVELEICFAKVWSGEDANTQLRQLSEQIKTQLAGEPVTEEPIAEPQVELLPAVEYEEGTEDVPETDI